MFEFKQEGNLIEILPNLNDNPHSLPITISKTKETMPSHAQCFSFVFIFVFFFDRETIQTICFKVLEKSRSTHVDDNLYGNKIYKLKKQDGRVVEHSFYFKGNKNANLLSYNNNRYKSDSCSYITQQINVTWGTLLNFCNNQRHAIYVSLCNITLCSLLKRQGHFNVYN